MPLVADAPSYAPEFLLSHALHSSIPMASKRISNFVGRSDSCSSWALTVLPCRSACASCSAACSPPASSCSSATWNMPSRPTPCSAARRRPATHRCFSASTWRAARSIGCATSSRPFLRSSEVAAAGSKKLFRRHGRLIGEEVRALGFNIDFAPGLRPPVRGVEERARLAHRFREAERNHRLCARLSAWSARLRRARMWQALPRARRRQPRHPRRAAVHRQEMEGDVEGRPRFPIASCTASCRS